MHRKLERNDTAMKNVLVVLPDGEKYRDIIENGVSDCSFVYADQHEVTREQIDSTNIILGNVLPPEKINGADNIEFIALESAGADAYLKEGILAPGTVLTNATGAYSKSVAEHGITMTLSLMKHFPFYRDKQQEHIWYGVKYGNVPSTSPEGATVLIVGLGDIGLYYARLMKSLGSYIIGVKRRPSPCPEYVDELYTTDQIDQVIGRADVIFSVLPGTRQTYHFYDKELFMKMKKNAIFINCGRGASVDTEALCDALDEGLISSAGCDVFEEEPLPDDSRAWKNPKLFITPHRAGYFTLPDTLAKVVNLSARNLKAWLAGGELENVVDFSTGYKK